MGDVIELCVPYVMSIIPNMDEETARTHLAKLFPTLKRWRLQVQTNQNSLVFRT